MSTYKTPGVYIKEISTLSPSIAPVETSIPVFIGYTDKHVDPRGRDSKNVARKISSVTEFEDCYGFGIPEKLEVKLMQEISSEGVVLANTISIAGNAVVVPGAFLHYEIQMYFDNGGGSCFVMSIGQKPEILDVNAFTKAIDLLSSLDEPTLMALPDICLFPSDKYGEIVNYALRHCANNGNRMLVLDVLEAYKGKNDNILTIESNFRRKTTSDTKHLKYCGTYFPYVEADCSVDFADHSVLISNHSVKTFNDSGASRISQGELKGLTLDEANFKNDDLATYHDIISKIRQTNVIIPPSGAVVGAIAKNDGKRGVWKAPANIILNKVKKPSIPVSDSIQDQLNVDTSGKSINAIRHFTGKGNMIWGARTLAGNDHEWRYIPVVRFFMFAQDSIKKGTAQFVFEPNDINTWVKVKNSVENFLLTQWKAGALSGSKPEEAFFVKVGLGETMTSNDILNVRLIIEVGMAMIRPAEFVIMRLVHKMAAN